MCICHRFQYDIDPMGNHWKTNIWWTDSTSSFNYVMVWIIVTHNTLTTGHWIQMVAFVYTFIAILIELNKIHCFKRYLKMLVINDQVLNSLANDVVRFRNLKQKFEDTFNLFPLIWWSFWFIALSGNIEYLRSSSKNFHQVLGVILHTGLQISLTISFNVVKNYYINQCQAVCQNLADKLMLKSAVNGKSHVFMSVRQDLLVANYYTALGLFPLDNTFILSFASAVISFTVMCLNL